jgi:hypothetical protein
MIIELGKVTSATKQTGGAPLTDNPRALGKNP